MNKLLVVLVLLIALFIALGSCQCNSAGMCIAFPTETPSPSTTPPPSSSPLPPSGTPSPSSVPCKRRWRLRSATFSGSSLITGDLLSCTPQRGLRLTNQLSSNVEFRWSNDDLATNYNDTMIGTLYSVGCGCYITTKTPQPCESDPTALMAAWSNFLPGPTRTMRFQTIGTRQYPLLAAPGRNLNFWLLEPICNSGVSLLAAAAPVPDPVADPEPVASPAPCFKYYIRPANANTQLFLTCERDENDIPVISLSGILSGNAFWGSDSVSLTELAVPGDGLDTNLISVSCGCALSYQSSSTFCNSNNNTLRVTLKGNGNETQRASFGIHVYTSNEDLSMEGYSDWIIEDACSEFPGVSPSAPPAATPSASPAPCNIWRFKGLPAAGQTGPMTDGMLACTANGLTIVQQKSDNMLFEWRGTNLLTSSSGSSAFLWSAGCNCTITSTNNEAACGGEELLAWLVYSHQDSAWIAQFFSTSSGSVLNVGGFTYWNPQNECDNESH